MDGFGKDQGSANFLVLWEDKHHISIHCILHVIIHEFNLLPIFLLNVFIIFPEHPELYGENLI